MLLLERVAQLHLRHGPAPASNVLPKHDPEKQLDFSNRDHESTQKPKPDKIGIFASRRRLCNAGIGLTRHETRTEDSSAADYKHTPHAISSGRLRKRLRISG